VGFAINGVIVDKETLEQLIKALKAINDALIGLENRVRILENER
jgi:repressor of nif and glnA expression